MFPGSRARAPPPTNIWPFNLPPYPANLASQSAAQLTIPSPLIPSYQPVQPPQPQVDDEYHFPEIADLGKFDDSYLEGVRQKLAKTINNISWIINHNEGEAYLTPEKLRVLENQKAYKLTLINYKDAFISYLKQRRKIQEQMWEQEQNQETDEECFEKLNKSIMVEEFTFTILLKNY